MKNILVCRFSALGDVILSLHVLNNFVIQNKNVKIFFLTKSPFRQLLKFFENIEVIDIDLKEKHKGFFGLKRFCKDFVKQNKIDYYVDLHNVIRSRLISFFLPSYIKKAKIDKGRNEKKKLIKRYNKKFVQLKHTTQRYIDVFNKLGFEIELNKSLNFEFSEKSKSVLEIIKIDLPKIAIAPFAAHYSKIYPLDYSEKLIELLTQNHLILLFGGGQKEKEITEKWERKYKNVISCIGKFNMIEELSLIDNCISIFSMDSGNMHLASLTSTKIVSFWGATHPFAGFTPFNKKDTIYVQRELNCRPCTVFGKTKCYKNNYECLNIKPKIILKYLTQK